MWVLQPIHLVNLYKLNMFVHAVFVEKQAALSSRLTRYMKGSMKSKVDNTINYILEVKWEIPN